MNLSERADRPGVHPQTAYRWFREGTLPVLARQVGRLILVGDFETSTSQSGSTVIYARVSSADQRDDLDCHVARVTTWAKKNGHPIDRVVTEVGSGLNLTSFCARLYGRRAAAHRAATALAAAQEASDVA